MDRSLKVLQILRESGSWIKSTELSLCLNVSTRTIRNDIKAIKEEYGEEILLSDNNQGYKFNEGYIKIFQEKKHEYNISQNERLVIILKLLIVNKDGIDIYNLAEELFISEHTLETDISKLKKHINSIDNQRIKVLRKADIISLNCSDRVRNSLLYDTLITILEEVRLKDLQSTFSDIDLRDLYKIIKETIINNKLDSRYIYFSKFALDVALTIEQEKAGVKLDQVEFEFDNDSMEISNLICSYINNKYEIVISDENKEYIAYNISLFYKLEEIELELRETKIKDNFALDIKKILKEVSQLIGIDLLKKETVVSKFITHLRIAIERKKIGFNFYNPLINNLKNEYQFVFSVAIIIAEKIEENSGVRLNINEISYIVAYLLVMINDDENKDEKLKIAIVVCEGLANLEYISRQVALIAPKSNVQLSKFSSINDIKDFEKYKAIISTNNYIHNYSNGIAIGKSFNKVDKLKIKNILDNELYFTRKMNFRNNAVKFFRNELFETNSDIKDKNEAIKYLCNMLKKDGCVKEDFYDYVIERENIISSSIETGIAVPHSLKYKAIKNGAAVLVLKNGIVWDKNKVKLVILISVDTKEVVEFSKFANDLNTVLLNDLVCENRLDCKNAIQTRYMLEYIYSNNL